MSMEDMLFYVNAVDMMMNEGATARYDDMRDRAEAAWHALTEDEMRTVRRWLSAGTGL